MFSSLLSKLVAVSLASGALAAVNQLQRISNFGTNPTGVAAHLYRPPNVVANPALILALHYCSGTGPAYFTGTQYANLADQLKSFIILYPSSPGEKGECWDVHTNATFTHNAGGDSLGVASAVRYTIANYGVDASRVFVTGSSSGGMMTQVMAGAYPDLFVAAASFAGVPYACFSGTSSWNGQCSGGQLSKTGQQWGDLVRSGYPGYTGRRPRVQIFHGTADTTLSYNNHKEAIKQWTNVFGYSETPQSTQQNSPVSGMVRSIYGPNFQAITANNVGHDLPTQERDVLAWFCLSGSCQPTGTQPPGTTTQPPVSTQPPATTQPGNCAAKWGQCGGQGYTGPTCCASGSTCTKSNDWYSQCL
ncbi:acetyl xylan esterase [Coprinopsis sp. MPI-PUGE-AT-0042]|nr:acetyl xylan esterase [Coprinopsis sp. MPI-PUGE-AT-0042]